MEHRADDGAGVTTYKVHTNENATAVPAEYVHCVVSDLPAENVEHGVILPLVTLLPEAATCWRAVITNPRHAAADSNKLVRRTSRKLP